MQVEDVPRVGLAAWRPAQVEGHLAVGPSVLGEVVVAAQRVLAAVAEKLTHCAAGVGRQVDERGRLGGAGGDDDRVAERPVLLQGGSHAGDGSLVLADRHVDADQVFAFLVDDRVDQQGGLARLAIADDQLALSAADRDHGVDRLDAGLDRGVDRLACDHTGRDHLYGAGLLGFDGSLAVDRLPERVDDAADQLLAHRHLDDPARGADLVAFLDVLVRAHDHGPDHVLLEVQGHPVDVPRNSRSSPAMAPCKP